MEFNWCYAIGTGVASDGDAWCFTGPGSLTRHHIVIKAREVNIIIAIDYNAREFLAKRVGKGEGSTRRYAAITKVQKGRSL